MFPPSRKFSKPAATKDGCVTAAPELRYERRIVSVRAAAAMTSGDPRIDRRYEYARAALEEGDAAGAVDILEQTVAELRNWAPAWHLLGQAREAAGDAAGAIDAYRATCAYDPEGLLGAEIDLARLDRLDARGVAQPAYVARLFDDYAHRYEKHLRRNLNYQGPEILFEAVARACVRLPRPLHFARMLDLGCGTGFAGEVFHPRCAEMAGVDLSARMVELARRKQIYARLEVGPLVGALLAERPGTLDLVVAADVFVYVGDLAEVFAAVARALGRQGVFAFTVQRLELGDVVVGPDKRFAHSEAYLRRTLAAAGLVPLLCEAATPRFEAGDPVPGLAVVAAPA